MLLLVILCALTGNVLPPAINQTNVDFTAKVIWPTRGRSNTIILENGSSRRRISINDNRTVSHLSAGDVVHFVGAHVFGPGTMHWIDVKSSEILRHEPCGPVPECSVKDLRNPKNNLYPVSLRATVKDAFCDELDDRYFFLVLVKDGETVNVAVQRDKDKDLDPLGYVGAGVTVTGIVATEESQRQHSRGNRRFLGNAIVCRSPEDVQIVQARDAEPFAVPDIDTLKYQPAEIIANCDRHRTTGRVLAIWDDRFLLLRNNAGELCKAELTSDKIPVTGDIIDVVGFPESDLYHINLIHSLWRPAPNAKVDNDEEPPVTTSAKDLLANSGKKYDLNLHGRLVELRGTVQSVSSDAVPPRILIGSDDHLIPVAFPSLGDLQVGSLISVTGICVMDINDWHYNAVFPHFHGIFVVPRTSADIRLLARPPWWTRNRLASVIGVLFAVLAIFACWIVFLRRFALRKSRELLKEQLLHMKADLRTEERTRLSVELHDTVAQNLTGIGLRIDAAERLADFDRDKMKKQLAIASRTLLSCREELRRCLWDLRSRALDERTMEDAIRRTLQLQDDNVQISVRFKVPRSRIPDDTAHNVLRIVCELVTNAIRHGQATAVSIAGSLDGARLLFSVTDNGCGFDPKSCAGISEGHFGLQGVRERIRRYQGTLDITPPTGGGTKVRITMGVSTGAETDNQGNEINT